nr:hypothetical protein [uncultured bacterium]QLG20503.1 hypothetical protein [uncultured bacterium]
MFESIVYKNAIGPGPLIDVGALAEGLIFYGRVVIVGNTGTLKDLLARVPPFILLSLMKSGRIEFHYLADQTGVSTTQTSDGRDLHDLLCFSSPNHTIERVGPELFKAAAGSTGQARVGSSQFARLLRPLDHSGFDQGSILQSLLDSASTEASVAALIRIATPGYVQSSPLRFRIERMSQGFYVDTNIDFVRINEIYHQLVSPEHSSITKAYVLALLQGAYEATYFAATLDSEVAVTPIERVVQAKTVEAIVRRHTQSESQIEGFVDLTLSDARAIREAVNAGVVPFASIVKLLDSADKFRHWLQEQPIETGLLRAYYQATIKDSWADRLPGKSARWSVFTGIGLTADAFGTAPWGTLAGVAISAADSFLVDKLIKGWKPHQFVEGDLKSLFSEAKSKMSGK